MNTLGGSIRLPKTSMPWFTVHEDVTLNAMLNLSVNPQGPYVFGGIEFDTMHDAERAVVAAHELLHLLMPPRHLMSPYIEYPNTFLPKMGHHGSPGLLSNDEFKDPILSPGYEVQSPANLYFTPVDRIRMQLSPYNIRAIKEQTDSLNSRR